MGLGGRSVFAGGSKSEKSVFHKTNPDFWRQKIHKSSMISDTYQAAGGFRHPLKNRHFLTKNDTFRRETAHNGDDT
jgi:hypothetical protein